MSVEHTMALHVAAAVTAFSFGAWKLHQVRPAALKAHPQPRYEVRAWLGSLLPLALLPAVQYIKLNTDIVMLGAFRPSGDVGIYKVAASTALLVAFGLNAINMVVAPYFAKLYAHGDMTALQRLAVYSARAAFAIALPVVLVIWVFGEQLLALFFGNSFSGGHFALSVLATGQLFHAGLGAPGMLLTMSDHAQDTLRANVLGAVLNVILNAILIPSYGIDGACVATAVSIFVWKTMLWWLARSRTGCDCSLVGLPRKASDL
jgi:O-antigen/teichoic acid export membrane protein